MPEFYINEELMLWIQQRRKSIADRKKTINGQKCVDFELSCMEWTRLHHLVGSKLQDHSSELDSIKELLGSGLSHQADALGRKPLWYAAHAGNDVLIPDLMNGLDDVDVDSAFGTAVEWQRVTTACTILEERPTLNISDSTREVLAVLLHAKWDTFKVILRIASDKVLLSQFLNHACWCGDDAIVKRAVTLTLPMNDHDLLSMTPLHNAAQRGHLSTTELLLEAGADPCAVDSSGCTAAHFVCSLRQHSNQDSTNIRTAVLETLVEANPAVLNKQNNMGRTPLMEALYRGNEEIVIFIIKNFLHHLDTSVRDHFGFSYSHYSPIRADEFANGSEPSVGQDMKPPRCKGRPKKIMKDTVMRHFKSKRSIKSERYSSAVQMDRTWLIPFGFHGFIGGQEKTSVLHMCVKMNQIEVLDFLATSAKCSMRDDQSRTPLALAVDMMNVEAVTCLIQHVSINPSDIESLLQSCAVAHDRESESWQIVELLINCLDVDKIKDWLTDKEAEKSHKLDDNKTDKSKSNESKKNELNLLQYCFIWGSGDLVSSICHEIGIEKLAEGLENSGTNRIADLTPLETAALVCRQELLTAIDFEKMPPLLKNKMLVSACSFKIYEQRPSNHAPAEEEMIQFIDTLINNGAEVDFTMDGRCPSAITAASVCGLENIVIKLISCGASPYKTYKKGTPLEAALMKDHEDLSLKMMDLSNESELDNHEAWKIITVASKRGKWLAVDKLLNILERREDIVDKVYKDNHGDTCFHYCARQSKDELLLRCLNLLDRTELSPLEMLNKTGKSPLCCAVIGNNWRCAFIILAHICGAFPTKLLNRSEYSVFKLCNKSDPNTQDNFYKQLVRRTLPLLNDLHPGGNLLMQCCTTGDFEAVKELLTIRPSLVLSEDKRNRGPDFYAAINGWVEILQYLEDFRVENGCDKPSQMARALLLLAILIKKARNILTNRIRQRLDYYPTADPEMNDVRKHDIWEVVNRICRQHADIIHTTLVDIHVTDDMIASYWGDIEGVDNVVLRMTLNFLSLFTGVPSPLIENYYDVSDDDWSNYKNSLGLEMHAAMPYPDALVVALSGQRLFESDHTFLGSLIQTLASHNYMLTTVSVDVLLKYGELDLLCDIFSSATNIAQHPVKMQAAFLRACASGHFALAQNTSAFLKDKKEIKILGLNLSIEADEQGIVQILSKGVCPCSIVSAECCGELQEKFRRAWKRRIRPGWSPIFAAAASNNLPLLNAFLDSCEHVTDNLLTETALVAASRGSYEVLEYVLMRQPRVLFTDTENLTLVKTSPELAAVSLLACCVKSRQDRCGALVVRHMLSQSYLSRSLIDVLPYACELALMETIKSLLAIPDQITFSEGELGLSKSVSLELGNLEVFETLPSNPQSLLDDPHYRMGFSKFVREMSHSDGVEIPLPHSSTYVLNKLLLTDKETTVFNILQKAEEFNILSVFRVPELHSLLQTAVQSQSFGVLEPLLSILDHITSKQKVDEIVYDIVCLAIRCQHAESLRSIFLHRNISNLQMVGMPPILHVGAIFGDTETGKVLLEFLDAKDLEVAYNESTPHQVAVGFRNQQMTQLLNPLAVNYH